ncbi:hypothetical protein BDY21DRAFT_387177 [Lineolata rhizophorae]|uniref:F-box domain-containing protein n=1 Tax=Lineolata rhizophorae TaxID=578093 RepID=A0A6A6NTH9_9PEZI|nr:hypothetical protein BDY21DRAFT_387177 [Lineolata rhizophorae]
MTVQSHPSHLYSLPNELLLHILSYLTTLELLSLAPVSCRAHALVVRLIHARLRAAANPPEHTLLLECFPPSAKLAAPPFYCTYLSTKGLDVGIDGQDVSGGETCAEGEAGAKADVGQLGQLYGLYSRFRPLRTLPERVARRHPAGDVPGSRTFEAAAQQVAQASGSGNSSSDEAGPSGGDNSDSSDTGGGGMPRSIEGRLIDRGPVTQFLALDSHELFTQICTIANLVKLGPRRGLFNQFVEVEEGVVRVWKDWLRRVADGTTRMRAATGGSGPRDEGKGKGREREKENGVDVEFDEERTLWVRTKKNVGLRFNVRERRYWREAPLLIHADEDMPVSYDVEYEELLVRTAHLLLMVERSSTQLDLSGKAVVFGSF